MTVVKSGDNWHVARIEDGFEWVVNVGPDMATGENTTEADALRDVAYALDFLKGDVAMGGLDHRSRTPIGGEGIPE